MGVGLVLRACMGPRAPKSLTLSLMFCCCYFEILNNFERGTSRFNYAVGPTTFIASFAGELLKV